MMQDSYRLYGHNPYNPKSLVKVRENLYKIHFDKDGHIWDNYLRIISDPSDTTCIEAIDPEGGPFMSLGYHVTDSVVITGFIHDTEAKYILVQLEEDDTKKEV